MGPARSAPVAHGWSCFGTRAGRRTLFVFKESRFSAWAQIARTAINNRQPGYG
jgi:hypothetical protein